ncbi:ankyrin repeat domain-containing protein [Rhodoferax sp.]|uniref:ankyrin repeat domain-containing protein n=1 Tax=Rhodoferax sp. TaxID=50421 RepID=UPI00283E938C|nr:ankyrin repeat domain-containing protein [Rhodoferax sp.]MDR3369528.1 ankyrin repeat domain-containing protein [Rhodoferax sp.]
MAEKTFQRLQPEQVRAWLAERPNALLLDAREARHHEASHLAGSTRLDGRNHERLLMREPKSRPVLIYCYHGNASQTYASMFADFGFSDVADLIGGWAAIDRQGQLQGPQLAVDVLPALSSAPAQPATLPVAPTPPELAAWLIAEGFDPTQPEAPGQHGNTPLMHAAWRGAADAVNALLAFGVPLDAVNNDGNNALWLACVNGDPELIRTLVAAGVPIDHANLAGATALMYGASSGKHEVVATLLELGANSHLLSQDDFSALDMAASLECLQLLRAATRRQTQLPADHEKEVA